MMQAMRLSLRSGEKVVLSGVGSFHVKMRKAKVGRNPRTGQTVPIPPRRTVRFKISKELFIMSHAKLQGAVETAAE
jgi:DNA-binding protein HU-beta